MLHNEFSSVSRVKENFKHGLTGRGWKPDYGMASEALRNRKGGETDRLYLQVGRQPFTLLVVLSQILVQTIQQLAQLRQILATGEDSLGLIRDINRGINDSLVLMQTISPNRDPGIYANWQKVDLALQGMQSIYGLVAPSRDARVQQDADQSAAEAIALNNSDYSYSSQIDDIGERIKADSHSTSPGGAQKLTAESLGVMLHVMNASLRTQATGLKLQAQELAIENKKDKDRTRQMISDSEGLKSSMQSDPANFSTPRF